MGVKGTGIIFGQGREGEHYSLVIAVEKHSSLSRFEIPQVSLYYLLSSGSKLII